MKYRIGKNSHVSASLHQTQAQIPRHKYLVTLGRRKRHVWGAPAPDVLVQVLVQRLSSFVICCPITATGAKRKKSRGEKTRLAPRNMVRRQPCAKRVKKKKRVGWNCPDWCLAAQCRHITPYCTLFSVSSHYITGAAATVQSSRAANIITIAFRVWHQRKTTAGRLFESRVQMLELHAARDSRSQQGSCERKDEMSTCPRTCAYGEWQSCAESCAASLELRIVP